MTNIIRKTIVIVMLLGGGAMNKNELVEAVVDATDLSKADAAAAVDAIIDSIVGTLRKGGEVRLVGFGTFSVAKRQPSTGRNPRTGAPISIGASIRPKFKAGKGLKEAVDDDGWGGTRRR